MDPIAASVSGFFEAVFSLFGRFAGSLWSKMRPLRTPNKADHYGRLLAMVNRGTLLTQGGATVFLSLIHQDTPHNEDARTYREELSWAEANGSPAVRRAATELQRWLGELAKRDAATLAGKAGHASAELDDDYLKIVGDLKKAIGRDRRS